jgi:hypothetical protein
VPISVVTCQPSFLKSSDTFVPEKLRHHHHPQRVLGLGQGRKKGLQTMFGHRGGSRDVLAEAHGNALHARQAQRDLVEVAHILVPKMAQVPRRWRHQVIKGVLDAQAVQHELAGKRGCQRRVLQQTQAGKGGDFPSWPWVR